MFTEQIKTFNANSQLHSERIIDIEKDKKTKQDTVKDLKEQYEELSRDYLNTMKSYQAINAGGKGAQ